MITVYAKRSTRAVERAIINSDSISSYLAGWLGLSNELGNNVLNHNI
jgi:hypothetical protein